MLSANYIMATFMYAISGIMFWQMKAISASDSRIFPTAIAIIIVILASALVVYTYIAKEKEQYDFTNSARGFKLLGILALFVFATKFFGFYSCVPFFLLAAMYFLGQRNKTILWTVPFVITIMVIVFFDILFKVQIPQGILFDPYVFIKMI